MSECLHSDCPQDAVPVKVNRVFDSCSDKDCLTGVVVRLEGCELPPHCAFVKIKCVSIRDVCISVEPVPFNRGFYSIDLTYTFDVDLLASDRACEPGMPLRGTATATKTCILYGSESATKTFTSSGESTGHTNSCCNIVNLPVASVQVVDPVVLEAKIGRGHCKCASGETDMPNRAVILTLGLFSIVELSRPVTVLIPTYPYTVPAKACCANNDSPCEVFSRLQFPTEEFSPIPLEASGNQESCGCGCDE